MVTRMSLARLSARLSWGVGALLIAHGVAAQSSSGAIIGSITDEYGMPLEDSPIRAVNSATATDARAFSAASGHYELRNLPAGAYVVTIAPPCCALVGYSNDDVPLEGGQVLELDIELEEGGSLNALGDDPGTIAAELRSRQNIPDLPVPRTADGKPDLSGVWLINYDPFPEPAKPLPWAEEIERERVANNRIDHPHNRCLPSEPPRYGGSTPFITKFVQTPELIVFLFEDVPGFRQVFLDGRGHPEVPNPSWMGHSIGRWEGDTLVVDSVGFTTRGWTYNYPRSEQMRLEERYSRTEYGRMDVKVTIDDPGVFMERLVRNFRFDYAPQEELIEFVCENNKWHPDDRQ
jgi:hypothetical protein